MSKYFDLTEEDFKELKGEDVSNILKDLDKVYTSIDDKYSINYKEPKLDIPLDLNLDRMEYTMASDDELTELARQSLASKKLESVSKVDNSLATNVNSVGSQKEKLTTDIANANRLLDGKAQELKKQTIADAIKRGLSRSSIVDEGIKKVDADIEGYKSSNEVSGKSRLDALNAQIAQLVQLRDKTLKDIEESFSLQTDNKVSQLKEEETQKLDNATKYNNSADEKEAKYKQSVEATLNKARNDEVRRIAELTGLQAKYGATGLDERKLDEKVTATKEMLDKLSPQDAWDVFNTDGSFNYHLGKYYNYVRDYLKKKLV